MDRSKCQSVGCEMKTMTWTSWIRSLRSIAADANLEYLLGVDDSDHLEAWQDGRTPRQALQDLYEDAGCPLRAADAAGASQTTSPVN